MSTRSEIFREFVRIVTDDAQVKDSVFLVRSWQGNADDANPPTLDDLPWLRLSPYGGPSKWFATDTMEVVMTVWIETLVGNNDADASMNLWEALSSVMRSPDTALSMLQFGVTRISPSMEAYGQEPHVPRWAPHLTDGIYAKGTVELLFYD